MCSNYVYKRRRLQNSITLLSMPGEEVSHMLDCSNSGNSTKFHPFMLLEDQTDTQKGSGYDSLDKRSSSGLEIHVDGCSNLNHTSKLGGIDTNYMTKKKNVSEQHESNHHNGISDQSYSVNDSCSTSRSQLEQCSNLSVEADEMGDCSSSEVIISGQPSSDFISSVDLCLHVLKANESSPPSEIGSDALVSFNAFGGSNAHFFLTCKTCGCMGDSKNMLICDLCEEAFHLRCCREKSPFREEWYCRPCSSKRPRQLLDAVLGKSFTRINEEYKRRIMQKELGPIRFMLKDTQPYISGVRVGKKFQVDVPEWSADSTPVLGDHDSFGEPSLMDPAQYHHLNVPKISSSPCLHSIGNWVQCREVIYKNMDRHNSGIICGKWRRAPLSATQTDDWDCSCAVLWDPIHADCAVPQEIETEEVLKQLKFVEMVVRSRQEKKQRCGQMSKARRGFNRMPQEG